MSDSDIRAINEVSVKVGRLEASYEATTRALTDLTASVNRLVEKLDRSDQIAHEALQSVKSAHYRLKELGEDLTEVSKHYDGEVRALNAKVDLVSEKQSVAIEKLSDRLKADRRWTVGTAISCAGLFFTALGFLLKIIGG